MDGFVFLIDLTEDRSLVPDYSLGQLNMRGRLLTSLAKDNSAPGSRHTATFRSSDAEKPVVPVPKLRVVSLSAILAGRDLT